MDRVDEFRRLRLEMDLTQDEAASLLDRSKAWVKKLEQRALPVVPRYAILAMRYLKEHPEERKPLRGIRAAPPYQSK